ncbi:hypothetical protein SELMODRAFT_80115 [Selaginella moellendorffii]|uniref:Uncharacterized protein n=1 Tax=Selaginella moellendorffii TaxID=88036 RepID=D8QWL0_SELML|nr:hypothetical protein SELMODRAFT_80115 [Selaginella moellendorffii]
MAAEAIVIDAGSRLLKAGFAIPEQDPQLVMQTAMTKADEGDIDKIDLNGDDWKENAVNPIERGAIHDWEAMEDLWRYVFYTGLGWEVGNEGQILIADSLLTRKASLFLLEKTVQLMFETFNVNGFYAVEQPVLSVYAVGRISGCAVDVGHGKIDIAPVWEGGIQHNAVKRFEYAGQDLTELLGAKLAKSNPHTKLDGFALEQIKEAVAVSLDDSVDYEKKVADGSVIEHTLPDGRVISVGSERYTLGEVLYQPSLVEIQEYGITEQLVRSLSLCSPAECQKPLIENIVLSPSKHFPGFEARFQKEVSLHGTPSLRPSVVKPPEYMPERTLQYSAWIGGAILAKVVFPQNQHLTKGDYDEYGPNIVHRKCY